MPSNIFLLVLLLLAVGLVGSFASKRSSPKPVRLARQRRSRLILTGLGRFLWKVVLALVLAIGFGGSVDATLAAAGSIPIVSWARGGLHAGAAQASIVVAVLVVLCAVTMSVQYVLRPAFRALWTLRTLDSIWTETGRAERIIGGLSSIVGGAGTEEFIYRALLPVALFGFTRQIDIAYALALVFFTIGHEHLGKWGLLNALLVGFALTFVYLATEQIAWAIAVHAIANAAAAGSPELILARRRRAVRQAIDARATPAVTTAPTNVEEVAR